MSVETTDETRALLPFFVNGTLDEDERRVVLAALEADAGLREEARLLSSLRQDMQDAPLPHPGDTAFARLMKEVARTPQDPSPASEEQPQSPSRRGLGLRLALVAAVLVLALQSVTLWQNRDGIRLASGDTADELIIAFQPDATERDIRDLLLELDLQIVSGPSSLGLYRVRSAAPEDDVAALSARQDIVESAENAMD